MSRTGGKRDSEDPFNPFAPDAIDERNRRHSSSTHGIRKKVNANAPQHSAWSRPAEGRKEISTAPTKTPKSTKSKKPEKQKKKKMGFHW